MSGQIGWRTGPETLGMPVLRIPVCSGGPVYSFRFHRASSRLIFPFYDAAGVFRTVLTTAGLGLYDSKGMERATIHVGDDGSNVTLRSEKGEPEATMMSNKGSR